MMYLSLRLLAFFLNTFEPGYQLRDPSGPSVDLSEVFITLNGPLLLCSLSITIDCNHVDEIYDTSCLF